MNPEPTLWDQPVTKLDRFHNTTDLSGPELRKREMKTGSQNQIILEFFKAHPYDNFTPFQVLHYIGAVNTPITSIRRALSDLTDMGYLKKTDLKRLGNYGEKNNTWQLR